jgi:hypothetical protein
MSVTLQTSLGDLKLEVFCELVPKTAKVATVNGEREGGTGGDGASVS